MMLATQIGTSALRARLAAARAQTDRLFDIIRPDSLYERPIAERHRIIFYVGHLEAFDWNLLRERALGVKAFHPEFDQLFAFGIDPVGGGLPSDQPGDWPLLEEVRRYQERIRESLDGGLEAQELDADLLLNVAIEHRLMHAETLAYMLHQLPLEKKLQTPQAPVASASPRERTVVEVPAGAVTLGQSSADAFGWDNEFEAHTVQVSAFEIDRYKVTNREYLKYIEETHAAHPIFWTPASEGWLYRGMFKEIPLPLDWPVYVSHAEANVYARWAGKALPTEAEWQRAAYGDAQDTERPHASWAPSVEGNFDFQRWDPVPVTGFPESRSDFGLVGLWGNGWEWTSSLFEPFPGFQPFPFYPGYSANFFDGKHYVMKGGSARTAACMLRRSFRNWFQPQYPYVYAGFRCVTR
jgi:iron(II)-dependent oxidoreductase